MGRLGRATCTVQSNSGPDQPGGKSMYHYIREAKSLMSYFIYCVPVPYIRQFLHPEANLHSGKLIFMCTDCDLVSWYKELHIFIFFCSEFQMQFEYKMVNQRNKNIIIFYVHESPMTLPWRRCLLRTIIKND